MIKQKIDMMTIISYVLSLTALIIFILNWQELSRNHMRIIVLLEFISIIISFLQIKNRKNTKLNILNIIIAFSPWIMMLLFLIALLIFKPPLAP
ncbi:hypothetical protein ACWN8V_10140 [Vagococcus elongatus]|uniref:Uncharacterized protein n=1 Tax=Vagococcus elongatus TaxID=180344 RepID=A0A430AQ40_9ENTE|nr:hypothetical protein [Vagococcus elongatus]RSU10175.1 hypothetical protein CBF29_10335 [Vagococcus elongatus]